jgi:putative nucleotidyltransferase with HDIG domain
MFRCAQHDTIKSLENPMTREEALALVREFVKNESLVRHMLSVEAATRFYAEKYGEDAELWGLLGLLHDFDWEIHPTLEEHPQKGSAILRERGVSEEIIQDILSHADHTGVPRDTLRRKALAACDEITGLITAVALVRPSHSLYDLEAGSVKKKWKDKAFAAGASREEIAHSAQEFGVELWEHVGNVILAMRRIAPELGLVGNIPQGDGA